LNRSNSTGDTHPGGCPLQMFEITFVVGTFSTSVSFQLPATRNSKRPMLSDGHT
jgi:hypothetical protein